jgi:hypothetical protein
LKEIGHLAPPARFIFEALSLKAYCYPELKQKKAPLFTSEAAAQIYRKPHKKVRGKANL